MRKYLLHILIALDQLVNTLFGGFPDETISAAAWRWELQGKRSWPRKLIDKLFWFDHNHCERSYMSELENKHLHHHYRR
jgi:hypothetical protein